METARTKEFHVPEAHHHGCFQQLEWHDSHWQAASHRQGESALPQPLWIHFAADLFSGAGIF
jgi:hypothetical protein